jgi:hypothetical protein
MTDLKNWSKTAAANGTVGNPPDWPKEFMDKSEVNDTMRENMRAIRDWYEDPTWVEPFETEAETWAFAQSSTTVFTVSGPINAAALFPADRRVRLNGTVETFVVSATYLDPVTTVTVDDATVPASITSVELFAVALADSAFSPLGTAGATLVHAEDLGTAIGQAIPLGDAATKTIGSGAGEVGTWGTELGTAAAKDHGTSIGDVALHTEANPLAASAYVALPAVSITPVTVSQYIDAFSTTYGLITAWTDIAVPGTPDGVKWYEIQMMVYADQPGTGDRGSVIISMGPAGTDDDPTVFIAPMVDPGGSDFQVPVLDSQHVDSTPVPTDNWAFGTDNSPAGPWYDANGSISIVRNDRCLVRPASGDAITVAYLAGGTAGDLNLLPMADGAGSCLMIREIQGA